MLKSKVTARSQTTLPNGVRKALSIHPGRDTLEWEIRGDEAVVRRAEAGPGGDDPALVPFLRLLERDITEHPERLRGIPAELFDRWIEVTGAGEVDPDESIEGPVAL
jgi:antitoxin PrlF